MHISFYGQKCCRIRPFENEPYHLNSADVPHLPSQTSTASLHILTGILPLEAILDTQRLCYFHYLVTSDGTLREWAMKNEIGRAHV
jgi:hypothetical protein